jgi:hypothetical protein
MPLVWGLTLTPRVAYSFALSDNARTALRTSSYDGSTHRLWYGGVTVARSF